MVHIVGAGPGDSELITVKGAKYLKEADVVIYAGSLVNPELLNYCREDAQIHNSASMTLDDVVNTIEQAEKEGKMTVRLHTGDPSLYGAIREQMDELDELGIEENADPDKLFGSSDIGNVSFECPAFHPTIQIVDQGIPIHTKGFEAAVRSERGHEAIALGAKLIACDIAKIFTDEHRIAQMKADFENSKK